MAVPNNTGTNIIPARVAAIFCPEFSFFEKSSHIQVRIMIKIIPPSISCGVMAG